MFIFNVNMVEICSGVFVVNFEQFTGYALLDRRLFFFINMPVYFVNFHQIFASFLVHNVNYCRCSRR